MTTAATFNTPFTWSWERYLTFYLRFAKGGC